MKNTQKIVSLLVALLSISALMLPAFSQVQTQADQGIKNVIMLVPDGCAQSVETIARWYKNSSLTVDSMVSGTVETWMANSVITDSAPASTAFATGHKSTNGFISVGPRTSDLLTGFKPDAAPYVPLATVLEASKLAGKSTGLVATSTISHATPAGFSAHNYNRNDENDIIEQQVYNNIDVIFGGGAAELFPTTTTYRTSFGANWTGTRTDGENLKNVLTSHGYQFVDSKDAMMNVTSGKVWGLFAASSMQADIDRAMFAPTEPSLTEMTTKAIKLLSNNTNGFFLMVEGSQVDWANHANDPIFSVTDFIAFDNAVNVALNFAKQDQHTLVMAFPDHETGGFSLGSSTQDVNAIKHGYTGTTIEDVVNPLKGMQITSTGLAKLIAGKTDEQMKDIINQYWNLNLTITDIQEIKNIQYGNSTLLQAGNTTVPMPKASVTIDYAISEYVSEKFTVFGWTTHGHTGEDVPLWAYSPITESTPRGHFDNTQLANIAANALSLNMTEAQKTLYVNVADAFPSGQWSINNAEPANPLLLIYRNGNLTIIPVSKNTMTIYATTRTQYIFEGLVVNCPQINTIYLPQQAVDIIKANS
jgi:alkaline phosphatase